MLAKDEELTKVKEKHLYAEQQLRDMEEKQQQVNFEKSQSVNLIFCSMSGNWHPALPYQLQRWMIKRVLCFNVIQVLFILDFK